jgi:hypothetical protein
MAAEAVEELHQRVAETRAAFGDWQQRASDAMAELPQQLADAIEEFSATLRRYESTTQPA